MPVEFDDMDAIRDHRRLVHFNMTEALRRERYRMLRDVGHTYTVARRGRDWHERDFRGLLAISPVNLPGAYNEKESKV